MYEKGQRQNVEKVARGKKKLKNLNDNEREIVTNEREFLSMRNEHLYANHANPTKGKRFIFFLHSKNDTVFGLRKFTVFDPLDEMK